MTDSELELIARYLKGEATHDEQKKIEIWLQEDANRIQFEQFKEIWTASGDVYNNYSPDLAQARKKIQAGIEEPVKLNPWTWIGKAAAILIVMAGLVWTVTKYTGNTHQISMQEITTGAVTDSVVLSDGSVIWLNKETTLKYPASFSGTERRVYLSGEAFFKVAHNAQMPFVVEAQGTVTKVLGTSFNIKTTEDNVSVAVRTGRVSFSEHGNSGNMALLTPNEMGSFNHANHAMQKSMVDASTIPSWRNDQFIFKNVALAEVVKELSQYYDTSIQLDAAVPGSLSLTTNFEGQSLEEILEVICVTLDITVKKESEGYVLVRAEK